VAPSGKAVAILVALCGRLLWALPAAASAVPSDPALYDSTEPAAMQLSLEQAIDDAVRSNLTVRLAQARTREARGRVLQSAASLLPSVLGTASQSRIFGINLDAQGFNLLSFSGAPTVIGPFNVFDARLHLTQSLLDVSAYERFRSAEAAGASAGLQADLAKEQVAAAAALAYVEALRARKAIGSAQADLDLANQLLTLSEDLHKAGAATGVDVARGKTRVAEATFRLLEQKTNAQDADVRLKRVAGIPLGRPLQLVDILKFERVQIPAADPAIGDAFRDRLELRIAQERLQAEKGLWGAARAERLPSVMFAGDYGYSGNELQVHDYRTGSIGVHLALPIFTGRSIEGRILEARSLREQAEAELADMRSQVEEDVRLSLQALTAASDEVGTARTAVDLALDELKMAQARFSAGVGDNVEVLTAEDSLARARDSELSALARYSAARVNLSLALGGMRAFRL
jgi:outer membrane protein